MKKNVLLIVALVALMSFSCSSDDDNSANTPEKATLSGEWQLTRVDFSKFEEDGVPASDACVIELVSGYEFRENKLLYVILNKEDFFDPYAQDYWSWSGDIDDFKIIQENPSLPPYNFGLDPQNIDVQQVDGQTQMTFNSEMGNGSEAQFTLVKQEIDTSQQPELTKPDGSDYYCGFFDD